MSGWLDREQVADLLGISVAAVKLLENRDKLHARQDVRTCGDGSRRPKWVYDPAEVASVPTHYRNGIRPPGETAARAFEMFDEGKSIRDVVITLREMPQLIDDFKIRWKDSGGTDRVISPQAWEVLASIVGPFDTVTELVERVERLAKRPRHSEQHAGGAQKGATKDVPTTPTPAPPAPPLPPPDNDVT